MEYLKIGKIIKTYGLNGHVKVYVTTDFLNQRLKKNSKVFLFDEKTNEREEIEISNHKSQDKNVEIVKFKNVDFIDQAEKLLGKELHVIKDTSFLPKDTYYFVDLIGLKVIDEEGKAIGEVEKVEDFTNNISLRIKVENKSVLVPFITYFVKNVDLENKTITIHLIEGMLWKSLS